MSIYRGPYYPATGCDSSPRSGTNALMSWYLGAYRNRNAANLGTYACKRLGSGWSIHAERRAADLGTSPYGGVDSTWGWALANFLRLNSNELGIQCIILGRRIWSCSYPDAGWRSYGGEHHGHMHVELTPHASQNLTISTIEGLIMEAEDVLRADVIPVPAHKSPEYKAQNPTWPLAGAGDGQGYIPYLAAQNHATQEALAELSARMDTLSAGGGTIDLDALATAVADKIAERMAA
jgi:hypothetical protein